MAQSSEEVLSARLQSLVSLEAEQALLGGLLANNESFHRVDVIIEARHFAEPLHGQIYQAIGVRVRQGENASCLTLRHQFEYDPALKGNSGWKYLVKLENATISILALPDYAATIRDLWRRRELLKTAEAASAIAASAEGSAELAWAQLRDDGFSIWQADFSDQALAEILIEPRPTLDWLVENMIPMGEVTLLTGDGGIGKSYLALQLMMAVASGTTWLDLGVTKGSAYGLFCEDPKKVIHARALAIVERFGLQAADFNQLRVADRATEDTELFGALLGRHPLDVDWTSLWHRFCARMRKIRPTVLVIDTVADVFGGDENRRSQVRHFIRGFKHLALELGSAIVLAAHPSVEGMKSGSGISGSTAWRGSVRSHLYFGLPDNDDAKLGDKDRRVLRAKKANYSRLAEELSLQWDRGAFVRYAGGSITSAKSNERLALRNLIIEMVAEGEARDLCYSASPRAEDRYIVRILSAAHPEHSSKAIRHALDELLAEGVLLESERQRGRRGGLLVKTKSKPIA